MSEHSAENGLLRRLDQIEQTAHRVTPTDVGKWSLAAGKPSPADGVVIAPADLAWLIDLARTRVLPPGSADLEWIKAQRAAGWPDMHPEDYCHRCGAPNPNWWTDRETWITATTTWAVETGREGICCPRCLIEMHEAAVGGASQWKLTRVIPPEEKGLPADWDQRHRVVPPDAPPVQGVTYRCIRCDREGVGEYPRGECEAGNE